MTKPRAEPTPLRMTLGYHRPGDCFYHIVIPKPVYALGSVREHDATTTEDFAALAVGLHEHFHLMQEMLQGYSLWRQSVLDSLAVNVADGVRRVSSAGTIRYPLWDKPVPSPPAIVVDNDDPLFLAKKAALELERCDQLFSYTELTEKLLKIELQDGPHLAEFLTDDAYQLTTRDLLECHAALLTQFQLELHLTTEPARFKDVDVESLAPLFQVEKMPELYGRPLRVLAHVFDRFKIRFQAPPSAWPVYSRMTHGAYYLLLAFLIDYALHIPPDPVGLCNRVPDGGTLQDTYPPMRFINLLFNTAIELKTDAHGRHRDLVNEAGLYDGGDTLLAECINDMHRMQRERVRSLSGSLLPHLQQELPDTFFTLTETTDRWRGELASAVIRDLFPLVWKVYDAAIQFRKSHSDAWFKPNLITFDVSVGLPILVDTGQGLHFEPYFKADQQPDEETLKTLVQKGLETYYRVMHQGEEWQTVPDPGLPATIVPFPFIESVMARSAFHRFALAVLLGERLCCPLTESVGRSLPCKQKSVFCLDIPSPSGLPREGCWLREVVTRLFIEPERLQPKKQQV